MGAIKLAKIEVQELSLDAMEVLPEMLQTRAKLDMAFVKHYADLEAKGISPMPPGLAYHTPDDRLLLADGFHRHAAKLHLRLRSMPCIVRDGTVQDALLAGIAANLDPLNSRKVELDDRRRSAEMMIRDDAFRVWPDIQISRRVGLCRATIAQVRLSMRDRESIPIPDRVIRFKDGKPSEIMVPYSRLQKKIGDLPVLTYIPASKLYRACVDGKLFYLGSDVDIASEKLKKIVECKVSYNDTLRSAGNFHDWLTKRGIAWDSEPRWSLGGTSVGDAILLRVPDADYDGVLREVGRGVLIRQESAGSKRVVLVGYFGSLKGLGGQAVQCARELPQRIEFMTPEELVAEFGPKEESTP
jgi:hypothetical protein